MRATAAASGDGIPAAAPAAFAASRKPLKLLDIFMGLVVEPDEH
ncbi:hypothetical protein [Promicromonospora soli]|nr:hypothetical protein [Promicromonospora soli]